MPLINPTIIDFAKTALNKSEPSALLKDKGWINDEIPTSANMNFIVNGLYVALKFLMEKGGFQYDSTIHYPTNATTVKEGRTFQAKVNDPANPPAFQDPEWAQTTREVFVSQTAPTASDGKDGDIWIVY